MSVSQDQELETEKTIIRVLGGARANDTASLPKQHTHRTPQCLPVSRVFAVAKSPHGAWTAAEQQHLDGCAFCRGIFATFNDGQTGAIADDETTGVINLGASDETTTVINLKPPTKPPAGGAPPAGK